MERKGLKPDDVLISENANARRLLELNAMRVRRKEGSERRPPIPSFQVQSNPGPQVLKTDYSCIFL